jgi:hypothetical protein
VKTIWGDGGSDLHVRAWGNLRKHGEWLRVFTLWASLMRRYHDHAGDDLGWWHGERPNISLLANAIVLSGGSAVQEYIGRKGQEQRYGRPDLFTIVGGRRYSIEGKQAWIRLGGGVVERDTIAAFRHAVTDAKEVMEERSIQAGACFVTIKAAARKALEMKELVSDFRSTTLIGARTSLRLGFASISFRAGSVQPA